MIDVKDLTLFPCKKVGTLSSGLLWKIDYEFLYTDDDEIKRGGVPLQTAFDPGWDIDEIPVPIGIIHRFDIERLLEINEKECHMSREEMIMDIIDDCEWATDTFIVQNAREYLEELKKELIESRGE